MERTGFPIEAVLDGKPETYWTTEDWQETAEIVLEWETPQTFTVIELQEHIAVGQRIEQFHVDAWVDGAWQNLLMAVQWAINACCTARRPHTDRVRIVIEESRFAPTLEKISLLLSHYSAVGSCYNLCCCITRNHRRTGQIMKNFTGKTAVITGGAAGIGFAFAQKSTQLGMNIVIADIESETMETAAEQLREFGTEVLCVKTDVSDHEQVDALAQKAFERFGNVHLLFNNAGVAAGSSVWETSNADWDWVLGVNLKGVINGVRAFVPRMLESEESGHIINTASVGGLVSYHPGSTYHVTKHAVVALSENMYHMMNLKKNKIGVSVVCPGWVKTRILEATRNRPADAEASFETEEERIVRESFSSCCGERHVPQKR